MLVWITTGSPVEPMPYVDASGNEFPPNMEAVWSAAQLAAVGMQVLAIAPQPTYNPATQTIAPASAPTLANGQWTLGWTISALPAAQLVANAAQAAIAQGVAITSTSTPALNGTYACDPTTQDNINSEIAAIELNGTFANQQLATAWPNSTGAVSLTIAQFKEIATAIGAYVAAVDAAEMTLAAGGSATFPSNAATIP